MEEKKEVVEGGRQEDFWYSDTTYLFCMHSGCPA